MFLTGVFKVTAQGDDLKAPAPPVTTVACLLWHIDVRRQVHICFVLGVST